MRYLLDTNIISHLMREPQGAVTQRIAELGEETVFTSILVAAELRYGAARKASPRLNRTLLQVLGALTVEPFTVPADTHYAALRAHLERMGTPISQMDMLIAAQALAVGATLVTANEREFTRVLGLTVENWLR